MRRQIRDRRDPAEVHRTENGDDERRRAKKRQERIWVWASCWVGGSEHFNSGFTDLPRRGSRGSSGPDCILMRSHLRSTAAISKIGVLGKLFSEFFGRSIRICHVTLVQYLV
ncbi:hypothetical protein KFK09_015227 [Dendrobium nobile]|uniref:Uncharacterized protein n=1 Tax=Dendrobium nobile TaxID=94219 RepID=A0A8T3B5J4_DENNO|nr:hypothetical protein KFK09_015227 [Dendrobium nobile]